MTFPSFISYCNKKYTGNVMGQGWFRHEIDAIYNPKIQKIFEEFGHAGYAYYFILIEACSSRCHSQTDDVFIFEKATLCRILRINKNTLEKFLFLCDSISLFAISSSDTDITIKWPKLLKYKEKISMAASKRSANEPYSEAFEKIFTKYPRKVEKRKAFKSFKKIPKSKHQDLDHAVQNYATQCTLLKTEKRFIKHFSTFINQGSWEDYVDGIPENPTNSSRLASMIRDIDDR